MGKANQSSVWTVVKLVLMETNMDIGRLTFTDLSEHVTSLAVIRFCARVPDTHI